MSATAAGEPSDGGARDDDARAGRALMRDALRSKRGRVAASATLLGAHQGFEALVPVVVGATLDAAVETGDASALVLWLAVLVVLFAFLSNAFRFGSRIGTRASEEIAHDLRMRLVERVLDPRGGGEGGRLPGELLSVATADVDATAGVVRAVAFGVGVAVALVAGAAVLLAISIPLGLLVLVGLPVLLWLAGRLAAPLERRAAGEQQRAADAAGVATDLVGGHRVLQGLGAAGAAAARYRVASRSSLRATMGAARVEAAVWASAVLVGGVALAVVALVGGRLAARGEITIGQLIAAVGVTQFLVGPLDRLAWVAGLWARARGSATRLATALAAPPAVGATALAATDTGGPAATDAAGGPAAFRLASAGLGGADTRIGVRVRGLVHGPLAGVDLDVAAGAVHGVVAEPAAAAALLAVLGRETEPAAGTVELVVGAGEVDVAALDPAVVRRLVVVSPHDATLFAETVRANVAATVPDGAEPATVTRAVAAAAADELEGVLPGGLDTRLSDGGSSLSGGQRQRIALARALATAAPVLVLHDPTTALDAATEARVAAALRAARGGRTTILVATSPALLATCDAVTVLRDGTPVATTTHADLVASDPAYRHLVLA